MLGPIRAHSAAGALMRPLVAIWKSARRFEGAVPQPLMLQCPAWLDSARAISPDRPLVLQYFAAGWTAHS